MMSLTIIGLTPGPLVRVLFPCTLTNQLVVLVDYVLVSFSIGVESKCDIVTFVVSVPIVVDSKGGQLIKIFWRSNS